MREEDDRTPEANAAEFRGDHWDADATDPTGEAERLGETLRDEVPDRPEGGEVPRDNEDRLGDRS